MKKNNRKITAFSLIELSIVITIIAIIVTGTLAVSIANNNSNKIKITTERMERIYQALGTYLLANKKLPCPALMSLDRNNISYGTATTSNCSGAYAAYSIVYGAVPTKTLELPSEFAEDGFGNKIAYIVNINFTSLSANSQLSRTAGGYSYNDSTNPSTITAPSAILQISANSSIIETKAILILLSHGANRSGGFPANDASSQVLPLPTSGTDEYSNIVDGSAGPNFDDTFVASSTSTTFDDFLFYKTRTQLLSDFNAFEVMGCENSVGTYAFANYGQTIWKTSTACTTPTNQKATRKCGALGVSYVSYACTT